MTGPSQHLSWAELACRDGTPYPDRWRSTRAGPLAREFERIRAACGHLPLRVLSGYRTPTHNRRVGGARRSQHLEGRALDLKPPTGWTVDQFYHVIRPLADEITSAIYGIGRYPTFVHIDIRPPRADGRLTVWHGARAWAEPKRA